MNKWPMVAVLLAVAISGCGGGGGTQSASKLGDYAGVWAVEHAGLPDDQLLIDNAGNILVSVTASRAGSTRYRIGECSATGVIDVSGSWPESSTVSRHIVGEGVVTSSRITLAVVVTDGETIVASGTLDGYELDAPPPPPYNGDDDVNAYEELDAPPRPPY